MGSIIELISENFVISFTNIKTNYLIYHADNMIR